MHVLLFNEAMCCLYKLKCPAVDRKKRICSILSSREQHQFREAPQTITREKEHQRTTTLNKYGEIRECPCNEKEEER
jgi:hypothetical protein